MKQELNLTIPTEQLSILIQKQVNTVLESSSKDKKLSSSSPSASASSTSSVSSTITTIITTSTSLTSNNSTETLIKTITETTDLLTSSILSLPPQSSPAELVSSNIVEESKELNPSQISEGVDTPVIEVPSTQNTPLLFVSDDTQQNNIENNTNIQNDITTNNSNNSNLNINQQSLQSQSQSIKDVHSSSQDSSESLTPRADSSNNDINRISGGLNEESNSKSEDILESSSETLLLSKDSNHPKIDDLTIPRPDADASPEELADFTELLREIEKIDKECRAAKRVFEQRIQKHKITQVIFYS